MALFPTVPRPSSVSAPAILDPKLAFSVDNGIEFRRPRTSRRRRRYTLEYAGVSTTEVRYLRDFLGFHRLGVVAFQWLHPTAQDNVLAQNTTPIILNYAHGLMTGEYIYIGSTVSMPGLIGIWQVTRIDTLHLALNGTVASGTGTVNVQEYLPFAVARFQDDTWESATKIIGPDQIGTAGGRTGYFSLSLLVEEVF